MKVRARILVCWLSLIGWSTLPLTAATPPEKEKSKETLVRFLCVGETPPKYKRAPDGGYISVPYEFGEVAPSAVYLKSGTAYEPKPFVFFGISEPHFLKQGKSAGEGYFIDGETGKVKVKMENGVLDFEDDKQEGAPKRVRLAGLPAQDGGEHLICLYQPKGKSKWYPPKVMDIATSLEVFPAGKLLIINLSEFPLLIQTGAGTRPFGVKPAEHMIVPHSPGASRVKIVMSIEGRQSLLHNRDVVVPQGQRGVLTISASQSERDSASVNTFILKSPPVPAVAPAPKK